MNSAEERVDQLLSDRRGVPWVDAPESLRTRTHAALEAAGTASNQWKVRVPLAAAACVAVAVGFLMIRQNAPTPPVPQAAGVGLDPASFLGSALAQLTSTAEESLASEAREILEDTNRFTRRVIAQLPFTGGG